jgi:aminomethyltransferase
MTTLKRTPLYDEHLAHSAKMVGFAGWDMPIQYTGLREEHLHVRHQVGLFDVSHMGEIRIRGEKSLPTVEWLCTNYAGRLRAGQAQYTLLGNPTGGLVDDLIVYCLDPGQDYLLCVNASNTQKDFAWIVENNRGADVTDESDSWGQIAVQGPQAIELLEKLWPGQVKNLKAFEFFRGAFSGQSVLLARTGYTGEDGAEIFVPKELTQELWRKLLSFADLKPLPIGLGARDTLRAEMRYPLYGQEISAQMNPYAASLGWAIKPEKKDFIGRKAMLEQKENLTHQLVGFVVEGRAIPRQGYNLFSEIKPNEGHEVGYVTTGTLSPTLNVNIGIAYVALPYAKVGTRLALDVRNKKWPVEIVKTPFIER